MSSGNARVLHNGEKKRALSAALMQSAATLAFLAAGAGVARADCTPVDSVTGECTGDEHQGINNSDPSTFVFTLNVHDLTTPIAPTTTTVGIYSAYQGVALEPSLTVNVDQSATINVRSLQAYGIYASAQNTLSASISNFFSPIDVNVNSAAAITVTSDLPALRRADFQNRVGDLTNALAGIDQMHLAIAALEGDQSVAAQNALWATYQLLDPIGYIFGQPINVNTLTPRIYDHLYVLQNTADTLGETPPPAEQVAFLSAGIRADNLGGAAHAAGGDINVLNTGVITMGGAFGVGIEARSQSADSGPPVAAGAIHITNDGTIQTSGASGAGIFTQSIGSRSGRGGDGGHIIVDGSGSITTLGSYGYGIYAASTGGLGFTDDGFTQAGNGGVIGITYGGAISTEGRNAIGILGVSTGGQGAYGGNASGDDVTGDSANPGGIGGNGGVVSLTLAVGGSIHTIGDGASAISGTSVAGAGGFGGSGNDFHGGGWGGLGGLAGAVTVENSGQIRTEGDDAYGMQGQSLSGDGGVGGDGDGIFVGHGSTGGPAGAAGAVTANNYGSIVTLGDRSFGIFAQSIAGRGGAGGDASGVFVAHAGQGGSAESARCTVNHICPDGGIVQVLNEGSVDTSGFGSHDIFAQSIGGGGGAGGDSTGWISVSGGEGGDAGDGQFVEVINRGHLGATGDKSSAIFAQSIGGGGGAGGDVVSIGAFAAVAIGAQGGAGGDGGDVHVQNDGEIITGGQRTDAIRAQSVGGGGGVGGSATAFAVGIGGAASVAVGGNGEVGGDGHHVTVDNNGSIETHGDFSNAILAQSIGGGGGQGGSAFSFSAAGGDHGSVAVAVAVGGGGGKGGVGGLVDVTNAGSITTYDFNSFGILAQSIGGGGGLGGASTAQTVTATAEEGVSVNISIAVGGAGGDGDHGGDVGVTNDGSIVTLGDGSTGIFAQSVGGGGGAGGDASSTTMALSSGESSSVEINVSVGGKGGDGNDGGNVTVLNNAGAMIITLGDMANGITAQSVGGGGGVGGAGSQGSLFEDFDLPTEPPDFGDDDSAGDRERARNRYASLQNSAAGAPDASGGRAAKRKKGGGGSGDDPFSVGVGLSIGGGGGGGGHGHTVDVTNYGEIITGGVMSMGVFAQSVGGGGGIGGGGTGTASGEVGAGLGIGGQGGLAGNGGEVFVHNYGAVTTLQAMSYGIFAQSVGGGGGVGGLGAGELNGPTTLSLAIGGSANAAGDGNLVHVFQTGDVMTFGLGAIGVLAQSVGGGGGVGGSASEDTYNSIGVGGVGGAGGNGQAVDVHVDGNIITEGNFAHGVFAQSVGGGGGLGGGVETRAFSYGVDPFGLLTIDTGLTLSLGSLGIAGGGGDGGDGQRVTVDTTGTITTFGRNAYGIFAQSVGGGGGAGGGADLGPLSYSRSGSNGGVGVAGNVVIDHHGDIHAYGENSAGIFAQSMSGATLTSAANGRGGDISITLHGGNVLGGSGEAGVGVFFSGGANNTLDNLGGSISALSGIAIVGTDGDEHIHNYGLIDGNIGLGGGANTFNNYVGGIFQPHSAINIGGSNSTLFNDGVLSPFGSGVSGVTEQAGNVVQSASGVYAVDLRFHGLSDSMHVRGAATLAGEVRPLIEHAADIVPGQYITVLTADSVFASNLSIDGWDTLVVNWGLHTTATSVAAGVNQFSYRLPQLNEVQTQTATYLQGMWGAGGSDGMNGLLDFMAAQTDIADYEAVLDTLNPNALFTQGASNILQAQSFLSGMMSCPVTLEGSMHETACAWARASHTEGDQNALLGDRGYNSQGDSVQAGVQYALRPGWFGGLSLGYGSSEFRIDPTAAAANDTLSIGGALKHEVGPWLFAAAGEYSHISTDRHRLAGFPTLVRTTSSNDTDILALRLRAAYLIQDGIGYLRPSVELDGYQVHSGSFNEHGAGDFDLQVQSSDNTFALGTLSLEGGANFVTSNGVIRPFVSLGASMLSDDHIDANAQFEGAPDGAPDFVISNRIPEAFVRGQVGVDVQFTQGSLRLDYEQREGHDYSDWTASLKARWTF